MYFSIRNIRYSVAAAACLTLAATVSGDSPTWWHEGDPPVIDPAATDNNHGPANIGQAKWMAKSALAALRAANPSVASDVEAKLVGIGNPIPAWDPPSNQTERDQNHAPLLIGQLKAIAAPFYQELHAAAPAWLETQLTTNQTKDSTDPTNFYPWTSTTTDDQNKSPATIGQLKAVFALKFETLDADSDGLPDRWEREFANKMLALGAPPEHWGDNWSSLQSGNLMPSVTLQEGGLTIMELYNGSEANDSRLLLYDVFMQAKRAEFRSSAFYQEKISPQDPEPEREGSGKYSDGSPGYGWGTIETWSRSSASSNTFEVSLDPFSISPEPTLDWVKDQNDSLTWTYHTHWDDAFQPNARTLFPLDRMNTSSVSFMLNNGGASSYSHYQKTWQEGDTTVTRQEWKGDSFKSKFRLYRPRPTREPLSLNFLKVTTEHSLVDQNPPDAGISLGWAVETPITTKEVVTVTIPAYGHTSPWIETSPATKDLKSRSVELSLIEVTELSPNVKDEEGNDVEGSEKPSSGRPLTPFVEVNPYIERIAHREIKVRIGQSLRDKRVTWSLGPVPGALPANIRGQWSDSPTHHDCFEASADYGANGFHRISQQQAETTIASDGQTAIRVNVPPIGFNQVRVRILVDGITTPIDLIDMEVPAIVVIDPGHGGLETDPPVAGSSWNNATSPSGVLEQAMALNCGLAVRTILRNMRHQDKLNLRMFMTREVNTNVSGAERAARARDNGADVMFVIHFNSDDEDKNPDGSPRTPHRSRGTLEVYRTSNNVVPQQDTDLSSRVIDRMVAAIHLFDPAANHRARVGYDNMPAVSSDLNNGNIQSYHPIRTAYIEGEFIDFGENTSDRGDDAVDILLNTGPNAAAVNYAIANAIGVGILEDLRIQPQE